MKTQPWSTWIPASAGMTGSEDRKIPFMKGVATNDPLGLGMGLQKIIRPQCKTGASLSITSVMEMHRHD
ncbi:MAG: hypothetical protein ABW117_17095 [Candidatus Sedimenticola sp. 1PA]